MIERNKAILKGALIGGIGGPVLLTALITALVVFAKATARDVTGGPSVFQAVVGSAYAFFIVVAPFSALNGGILAWLLVRKIRRGNIPKRFGRYGATLGAALGIGTVLTASLFFLIAVVLIGSSRGRYLQDFKEMFLLSVMLVPGTLPLAVFLGMVCGWWIARTVRQTVKEPTT